MTTTTTTAPAAASTAIGSGDSIQSAAELRAEAATAEAVLEEFIALIQKIGAWANELPERYVGAPFGTDALTAGVTHVTEASGDATAISEALAEILTACDEADALGETVTGIEADGRLAGFTQQ